MLVTSAHAVPEREAGSPGLVSSALQPVPHTPISQTGDTLPFQGYWDRAPKVEGFRRMGTLIEHRGLGSSADAEWLGVGTWSLEVSWHKLVFCITKHPRTGPRQPAGPAVTAGRVLSLLHRLLPFLRRVLSLPSNLQCLSPEWSVKPLGLELDPSVLCPDT